MIWPALCAASILLVRKGQGGGWTVHLWRTFFGSSELLSLSLEWLPQMLLGAVASRSHTHLCLAEKLVKLKEEVTANEAELEEATKISIEEAAGHCVIPSYLLHTDPQPPRNRYLCQG